MNDASLYVPWKGNLLEMVEELNTIESIHKQNMQEFCKVRDSIKNLPTFDIIYPVKLGQCKEHKEWQLTEEQKCLERFEQYKAEYSALLERESQLMREIAELERNPKRICLEKLEDERKNLKEVYQKHKFALNVAKDMYSKTFGMDVSVEGDESSDVFTATVVFKGKNDDFPVKFTINRVSNALLDFDASSFAADEELEELRTEFRRSNDAVALTCALKKLVANKTD